ncbi:MAG TPA: BON domain-containing protein [Longimicrobiaceae bacterium]|nr:BON domain-containing protein [Longimicrobiaceae bacterium]
MRVFREPEEEPGFGKDALAFAVGALGGLAVGMIVSRRPIPERAERLGNELRDRARTVSRRLRPARLRRMTIEQDELTRMEDAVLDAFLADDVLSERGIDVGGISAGIVELSGSVRTEAEAEHAVATASAVPGVKTVVNRMATEEAARRPPATQRRLGREEGGVDALQHTGPLGSGMGRRRQSRATDPDRPDDSRRMTDEALDHADREQWQEAGYAHSNSVDSARPTVQDPYRAHFPQDELDNQDPHGKHGTHTLDEPPQDLNPSRRVGQGLKSGEHLILENADVPLKPHGGMETEGEDLDVSESS